MPVRAFRSRRLTALVQLLLFAISSSTTLLPCAHEADAVKAPAHDVASLAPAAPHASHHDVKASATSPDERTEALPHHGSTPSHTTCPWVVGCVGMLRVDLDAPWRAIENATPDAAPVGITLRRVIVDRDVESPPPRD